MSGASLRTKDAVRKKGKLGFLILLGMSGALSSPAWSEVFDRDFPSIAFHDFEQVHTKSGQPTDPTMSGFRTEVRYLGKVRPIDPVKKVYLEKVLSRRAEVWGTSFPSLYAVECKVAQGGKEYWIPFQTELLSAIRHELRMNQPITVYLRYVGKLEAMPVYLGIHFSHSK